MNSSKPAVTLYYADGQCLVHSSLMYAGLSQLHANNEIRFQLQEDKKKRFWLNDSGIVCLEVNVPEWSSPRYLAFDLDDQSDTFNYEILDRVDLYFKRGYHEPDLVRLTSQQAAKVLPFGLNFACRTRESTRRLFWHFRSRILTGGIPVLKQLRAFSVLPRIEEFEQSSSVPLRPEIMFQTRVWEEEETAPGECDEINGRRVAIVKTLKAQFGERYRGGLVPTDLAKKQYTEELTSLPCRRRLYTKMSKRHLIGVYTRGLHHSTAFKFPEYLAASQCIVAEPPRNGVPSPLVAGKHYLPFETPSECVRACQYLLEHPRDAQSMRAANEAYYRAYVAPASNMRRILELALRETSVASSVNQQEKSSVC